MGRKNKESFQAKVVTVPPKNRLTSTYYSKEECKLAIDGKQIPQALGRKVNRLCVIRGIRQHPGFAMELHGNMPEFTRALNARQIMSDIIPDIDETIEFPYCIWYPDVANENTYGKLAERYPQMRYQVGRACAVAGYTELFRELNLLPEIHIAEEARDNGNREIFEDIMKHRMTFEIMSDLNLSIQADISALQLSCLNGETAVPSSLDIRRGFDHDTPEKNSGTSCEVVFDITEDFGVSTVSFVPPAVITARKLAFEYLYNPLPIDLPPLRKDVLALAAAHDGDMDRYTRIRYRDRFVPTEINCICRGIHHNPFFTKWWSDELRNRDFPQKHRIEMSITASQIMNNDLSHIDAKTQAPQLI